MPIPSPSCASSARSSTVRSTTGTRSTTRHSAASKAASLNSCGTTRTPSRARNAPSGAMASWYGANLKRRLETWFRTDRTLNFEVFNDWLPTDDCFVGLDTNVHDRWGDAVARVRIGAHPHDLAVGRYLAERGERLLRELGARRIGSSVSAGRRRTCRPVAAVFGQHAEHAVLDRDCRAHEVDNLFVTDGSFMPTGGSVPFTFTIYANSFRVADRIIAQLGGAVRRRSERQS